MCMCIDHIVVCSHLVVVVHHSANERALVLRALRHTVITPAIVPHNHTTSAAGRTTHRIAINALRNVFTFL